MSATTNQDTDIQQAVAEERERCARVCEKLALVEENWLREWGVGKDITGNRLTYAGGSLRRAAKVIRGEEE